MEFLALRRLETEEVAGVLEDRETRCETLAVCLAQIKQWSDRNPEHVPIFVMLEEKEIDTDAAAYDDALDRTLLSIWPRERLITPASVKGSAPTLREAITTHGWPMLDAARGKIGVFLTAMSAERKGIPRRRARRPSDRVGRRARRRGARDRRSGERRGDVERRRSPRIPGADAGRRGDERGLGR